jgi:hypothetical protein
MRGYAGAAVVESGEGPVAPPDGDDARGALCSFVAEALTPQHP